VQKIGFAKSFRLLRCKEKPRAARMRFGACTMRLVLLFETDFADSTSVFMSVWSFFLPFLSGAGISSAIFTM